MQEVSFLEALRSRYGAADDTAAYDPSAFLVGEATRVRNKRWEFVGMDAVRAQQSRFDRLEQVELREMNITVAVKPSEAAEDALHKANLRRLRALDLSANARLSLQAVATLVPYLPALQSLQLCDIPTLLTASATQPVLRSEQLTKVVLNHTGFRACAQLHALVVLPNLLELHLDGNELTSFDLDESDTGAACGHAVRDDAASCTAMCDVVFAKVTTLSLAHNRLCSWGVDGDNGRGLGHTLRRAFPALRELFLGDNALPNLSLPDPFTAPRETNAAYSFAQLTLLFVNDNARMNSPRTLDALRVLCPQLRDFRVSYAAMMPGWNETLSRMYVIASLPTLCTLNRGQVRAKERLDADVFYIQRGLAQRTSPQPPGPEAPAYPLLDELREKHKDLVLSIYREGGSASSDGAGHMLLTVTLRFENAYSDERRDALASSTTTATRTLPSTLTIGKLKALVRATFHIDPVHQALRYTTSDAAVLQTPIELDNELQTLAYYGVSNGDIITVRDTSLR